MKKNICDALLQKCIEHYQDVYEYGKQLDFDKYGAPPESIVIAFGTSQKKDKWCPIKNKEAVFRYSSSGLQKMDIDTLPDEAEQKMYHKEAYAELCYFGNDVAFIMIMFGKRYAQCYRYNIIDDNGNVQLENEKLLWIS